MTKVAVKLNTLSDWRNIFRLAREHCTYRESLSPEDGSKALRRECVLGLAEIDYSAKSYPR